MEEEFADAIVLPGGDMEDEADETLVKRNKKRMVKYLKQNHRIESFYSGGRIQFFGDVCYCLYKDKIKKYDWKRKELLETLDHVNAQMNS